MLRITEFFASGRSATASRSVGLEIGDDHGVAIGEDVLGLGDDVAVGGDDRLDEPKCWPMSRPVMLLASIARRAPATLRR